MSVFLGESSMRKCKICGKFKPVDQFVRDYPQEFFFKGMCADCRGWYSHDQRTWSAENLARKKIRLKERVLGYYGGECVCCHESAACFLILVGSNEEVGKPDKSFDSFLRRLARLGFPDGYTVICYNCNAGSRWGVCPHQTIDHYWEV